MIGGYIGINPDISTKNNQKGRFMNSISENQSRHRIVDRKEGRYLSFPDICELGAGKILIAYRSADKHVASESRLICKISDDKGKTWSERMLPNPKGGHCPRITYFADGILCIYDDGSQGVYWSKDEGKTWEKSSLKSMYENQFLHFGIADKVFELEGSLFSAIHINMGMRKVEITESGHTINSLKYPTTGQVIKSSLMIRSDDCGRSWYPYSLIACERDIVLCETSICKLQDGSLLAVHRENTSSITYESMYKTISTDNGVSWSRPKPIPIIGHRPTVGITRSGKILITYRNVAPQRGTLCLDGRFERAGWIQGSWN